MRLNTPVSIDSLPELTYADRLVCLGSCFASEMGSRLQRCYFDALVNPYGALYNPLSIARKLLRALDGHTEDFHSGIVPRDGGYCHFDCHSALWASTPQALAELMLQVDAQIKDYTLHSRFLLITLGSAWLYELPDGRIVGNCHRVSEDFTRRLAHPVEVLNCLQGLLDRLHTVNPKLVVLLSVSPIRHLRDGLRDNAVSKGVLLYAAYVLREAYDFVHYIPTYEILQDELRDYRFYADDMVHPSELALQIVWERLLGAWCGRKMRDAVAMVERFNRAAAHRPNPRIAGAPLEQQSLLRRIASEPILREVGLDLWDKYQRSLEK